MKRWVCALLECGQIYVNTDNSCRYYGEEQTSNNEHSDISDSRSESDVSSCSDSDNNLMDINCIDNNNYNDQYDNCNNNNNNNNCYVDITPCASEKDTKPTASQEKVLTDQLKRFSTVGTESEVTELVDEEIEVVCSNGNNMLFSDEQLTHQLYMQGILLGTGSFSQVFKCTISSKALQGAFAVKRVCLKVIKHVRHLEIKSDTRQNC